MHIAYLTPEYPHPDLKPSGGLGTSIKNLAVALAQLQHQVSVMVVGQNVDTSFWDQGVRIISLQRKKHRFFNWYFERKRINRLLQERIVEAQIDLVEAPDWTGLSAFMAFSVPLVIRFHGSDTYFCKLEDRPQKLKNFLIERWAIRASDAYIAPTAFAGQLTRQLFKLKSAHIETIHYGLDLSRFDNPTPEAYEPFTLLSIGTVIRKKGVLELAKIFNAVVARVPQATLLMIGNDAPDITTKAPSTYALFFKLLSVEAHARCHYLGKIPYHEVQNYIKNAHVCVFPSFAETLGMVTIESMALQKPVVNTNIGWAKEIIENGKSGYLVHPEDTQAYADAIVTLFEDNSLCLSLGKQARDRVERFFDISKQAEKNIAFYKKIIGS